MLRKKLLRVFLITVIGGSLMAFGGNLIGAPQVRAQEGATGEEEVSLGKGKRKVIEVYYQRVIFPHKQHQKMVLAIAGGDKESACQICHHKKRKGRDPRACRRCHAGRMRKAKGDDPCLIGCHEKKATHVIELLKELPGKRARKGQRIKLKDAFHLRCKNCHQRMRALDLDMDSTKYMAPVEYCEGCHVPKSEEDRKIVEAQREAERKMTGDIIEIIKERVKEMKGE